MTALYRHVPPLRLLHGLNFRGVSNLGELQRPPSPLLALELGLRSPLLVILRLFLVREASPALLTPDGGQILFEGRILFLRGIEY